MNNMVLRDGCIDLGQRDADDATAIAELNRCDSMIQTGEAEPPHSILLWQNALTAYTCERLVSFSWMASNVRDLDLSNTKIGDEGALILSRDWLGPIKSAANSSVVVERLDLSACGISDVGITALCCALQQNVTLKCLILWCNSIGDAGCRYLKTLLREHATVSRVNLRSNCVTNKGAKLLASGISSRNLSECTPLKELNLLNNLIGPDGYSALLDAATKVAESHPESVLQIDLNGSPYEMDQLMITHPICVPANMTANAPEELCIPGAAEDLSLSFCASANLKSMLDSSLGNSRQMASSAIQQLSEERDSQIRYIQEMKRKQMDLEGELKKVKKDLSNKSKQVVTLHDNLEAAGERESQLQKDMTSEAEKAISMQNDREKARKDRQNLQQKVKTLQKEVESLQVKLTDSTRLQNTTQSKLDQLGRDNDSIRQQLKESNAKLKLIHATPAASAPTKKQRAEMERKDSEILTMKDELAKLSTSSLSAQGDLKNSQADLKRTRADVAVLHRQVEKLEKELSEEKEKRQESAEENQSLRQTISELDEKVADLTAVREDLEKAKQNVDSLEADRAKLELSLSNAKEAASDKVTVEEELQIIQKEKTLLDEENDALKSTMSDYEKRIAGLEHDCKSKADDLSSAQERIKELEDASEWRQQIDKLNSEKEELQGSLERFEERCASMQQVIEEASEWRQQIAELNSEKKELQDSLQRYEEHCSSMQNSIEEAGNALAGVQEQLDQSNATCARYEAKVNSLNDTCAQLMEEVECGKETARELESTRSKLSTMQERMRDVEALLEPLQEKARDADRLRVEVIDLEEKWKSAELVRRKLHNELQDLKGRIRVYVRVRPLVAGDAEFDKRIHTTPEATILRSDRFEFPEDEFGSPSCIEVTDMRADVTGVDRPVLHRFSFDRVFDPTSTQHDVFYEVSQLVQSALDGHQVCIFAYGQTGSGKTHTMEGRQSTDGIVPQAAEQIFDTIDELSQRGWTYRVVVSIFEIYCDDIHDLLRHGERQERAIKGDPLASLAQIEIDNPNSLHRLINRASNIRSQAETQMNDLSSRSHSVFQLHLIGTNTEMKKQCHGVLNLVDLAGSERLAKSGSSGERLKEAQYINSSLSALGDVIHALYKNADHIPYRNSTLTRVLEPYLSARGGKTMMIVTLAPSTEHISETLCSLRFGDKVRDVEIGPARPRMKSLNAHQNGPSNTPRRPLSTSAAGTPGAGARSAVRMAGRTPARPSVPGSRIPTPMK